MCCNVLQYVATRTIGKAKTSCSAKAAAMMMDAFVAAKIVPKRMSLQSGRSIGNLVAVSPSGVT